MSDNIKVAMIGIFIMVIIASAIYLYQPKTSDLDGINYKQYLNQVIPDQTYTETKCKVLSRTSITMNMVNNWDVAALQSAWIIEDASSDRQFIYSIAENSACTSTMLGASKLVFPNGVVVYKYASNGFVICGNNRRVKYAGGSGNYPSNSPKEPYTSNNQEITSSECKTFTIRINSTATCKVKFRVSAEKDSSGNPIFAVYDFDNDGNLETYKRSTVSSSWNLNCDINLVPYSPYYYLKKFDGDFARKKSGSMGGCESWNYFAGDFYDISSSSNPVENYFSNEWYEGNCNPNDYDNDGVINSLDNCPDTPSIVIGLQYITFPNGCHQFNWGNCKDWAKVVSYIDHWSENRITDDYELVKLKLDEWVANNC